MQMEKLSNYIKENSNSLEFYIVNEGLMDWIKKFWNWLFSDAKKNADKNGGNYRISNNSIKSVVKDKISFTYDFCQLNEKNMTKLLEIMGDNFKIAKKYFENNKKLFVFSVKGKSESDEEIFAFIFCELNESELTIKQIIFAQQIVQLNKNIENSNLAKGVVKDFNKWIKTKLKKYSLNQEVKPEVVNKEKIKLSTPEDKPSEDKPSEEPTDESEKTDNKKSKNKVFIEYLEHRYYYNLDDEFKFKTESNIDFNKIKIYYLREKHSFDKVKYYIQNKYKTVKFLNKIRDHQITEKFTSYFFLVIYENEVLNITGFHDEFYGRESAVQWNDDFISTKNLKFSKNDCHKLAEKMHDYIIENTDIKELH